MDSALGSADGKREDHAGSNAQNTSRTKNKWSTRHMRAAGARGEAATIIIGWPNRGNGEDGVAIASELGVL